MSGDLEVTNVGETLSKAFLAELSSRILLPAHVCETLLKSGWSLEMSSGKPAMWVQAWPKGLME